MLQTLWKEIREIDTGRKALRSFGLLVGGVLLAIGAVLYWRNSWMSSPAVCAFAGTGAALAVLGSVVPMVLKPVYRVWMALAVVLGFVMTRILLTVVFFGIITPVGFVMRLVGRDPLHRKIDPEAETYWIPKTYHDESPARLEKYY